MKVMTPRDAARHTKDEMVCDQQLKTFSASVMEGASIPSGTFDEFVTECVRQGMTVHSYWMNEVAVMSLC